MFPNGRYDDQVNSTAQALAWTKIRPVGWGWLEFYRELAERAKGAVPERLVSNAPRAVSRVEASAAGIWSAMRSWLWLKKMRTRGLSHKIVRFRLTGKTAITISFARDFKQDRVLEPWRFEREAQVPPHANIDGGREAKHEHDERQQRRGSAEHLARQETPDRPDVRLVERQQFWRLIGSVSTPRPSLPPAIHSRRA